MAVLTQGCCILAQCLLMILTAESTSLKIRNDRLNTTEKMRATDFDSWYRRVGSALTEKLLSTLEYKLSTERYALIYLHFAATTVPAFDNKVVDELVKSPFRMVPPLANDAVWPHSPEGKRVRSNLVLGGPNADYRTQDITGHAEHRVLQELPGMLQDFRETHVRCPNYVVFTSGTVPCHDLTMKRPSCATEIFQKYLWLKGPQGGNCPATKFVLGYNAPPPYLERSWRRAVEFLTSEGIIVIQSHANGIGHEKAKEITGVMRKKYII